MNKTSKEHDDILKLFKKSDFALIYLTIKVDRKKTFPHNFSLKQLA